MKKAGIIVGATVAGVLALSPLAFATEGPLGDGGSTGLVNGLNGNDMNMPIQGCNDDVMGSVAGGSVKDATGAASGAVAGLGNSASSSGVVDQDGRACGQTSDAGAGE